MVKLNIYYNDSRLSNWIFVIIPTLTIRGNDNNTNYNLELNLMWLFWTISFNYYFNK